MTLPIHPLAELFPPLDGPAFEALKADITANGLREPIVLWRGSILDGRNRYRALLDEDWLGGNETVEALLNTENDGRWFEDMSDLPVADLVSFVVSRNLHRRHLSESQRAVIAARLATMGQGRPAQRHDEIPADLPDSPPTPTLPAASGGREGQRSNSPQGDSVTNAISQGAAAAMMNVSERSVRSARVLFTGPIEIVDEVMAGRESVDGAARRLKAAKQRAGDSDPAVIAAAYDRLKAESEAAKARKKAEKQARRAAREQALGERIAASAAQIDGMIADGQRFGIILADPEWQFETYGEGGMDRSADNHYPTTPLDQIMARPVKGLAADDAALFLWATAPMLPEALAVMAAWGFTYKSHLVWLKDRVGTGYWFRNRHELLLVGTRGRFVAPAPGTQWNSALAFPVGEHSQKPPFAHEMIEALWPSLPKLEMNARAARPGWTVWGAEAPEAGQGEVS